ncbi:hypothetical protein SAMN04487911_10933 [Arenibacter nanhaiticus]|uniref:Uncharacterized protein n=1 Tax=Arenibacter nanhaiticus TaxID=558155 RepID=A0A1M6FP45_9FLAO|nr:hypothetical protein [Arenibacter nanhaiticus]SHI99457.1 hypothetical protein SAMN04487911_10933 [Arenibacter nanhaiticus]
MSVRKLREKLEIEQITSHRVSSIAFRDLENGKLYEDVGHTREIRPEDIKHIRTAIVFKK